MSCVKLCMLPLAVKCVDSFFLCVVMKTAFWKQMPVVESV
jgi:hypothetical protein